jgi:hypothetical protein
MPSSVARGIAIGLAIALLLLGSLQLRGLFAQWRDQS